MKYRRKLERENDHLALDAGQVCTGPLRRGRQLLQQLDINHPKSEQATVVKSSETKSSNPWL